jgi:hypothetical protein
LSGIVEADETFVLESFKGKRKDLPRPSRKRGGKAAKRGLSGEQIPVIVARDRTGATLDAVLPRLDATSITAALGGVIAPSTDFCCDGGSAVTAFARRAKLNIHVLLSHSFFQIRSVLSFDILVIRFIGSRRRGWKTRRERAKRVLSSISRVWLRCSVTWTGRDL